MYNPALPLDHSTKSGERRMATISALTKFIFVFIILKRTERTKYTSSYMLAVYKAPTTALNEARSVKRDKSELPFAPISLFAATLSSTSPPLPKNHLIAYLLY